MNTLESLFKNNELYVQALTHRSWVNEHKGERRSNERLEFLGDAILELVISRVIYLKFPDKEEGYLTALRASIVNTQNLAKVAKREGIGELIFLSKGEEATGRTRVSLLADTFEAIVGALYMDQGLEVAERFIEEKLLTDLSEKSSAPLKGPKSMLQELVQTQGLSAPTYKVLKTTGPDHAKNFEVEVLVGGKAIARATGGSKLRASERAAEKALLQLVHK